MLINAMAVCVGYAKHLAHSLDRWQTGSNQLTIVTSPGDVDTQELCRLHCVNTFVTDIFYANGADFNKGAALAEAAFRTDLLRVTGPDNWVLFFDADIVPPPNWRYRVEAAGLKSGSIYGSDRFQQPEGVAVPVIVPANRLPSADVIGFFCMFNACDPAVSRPPYPLFELHWPHAGTYDLKLAWRWPDQARIVLKDLDLIHFDKPGVNWCGVSQDKKLKLEELIKVRVSRRGFEDWEHERMPHPPRIEGLLAEPSIPPVPGHSRFRLSQNHGRKVVRLKRR